MRHLNHQNKKMNKEKSKLGVALVKEACMLCGKIVDGPIIMNTRLSEKNAEEVEKLHGEVVGYTEKPCEACQDMMSKGYLLIGYVKSKTDDMKNPYRNGNLWVIKSEIAERMFEPENFKRGACFIDVNDALALGLPDVNLHNGYDMP